MADSAEQGQAASSSSIWSWSSATQFMQALASDTDEFVETLSNENSDVIDDVRNRSKIVAHQVENLLSSDLVNDVRARSKTLVDRVQDALAQQSLGDAIWPTSSQASRNSSPSIPESKKGLVAGAGIDEHIAWLQNNISTYLQDPANSDTDPNIYETFQSFCARFTLTDGDKATMLAASTTLEAFYHELVPSKVTDSEFWTRYLFLINEAKEAAARRQQLLKSVSGAENAPNQDLELSWTADNDSEEIQETTEGVGLSESDQDGGHGAIQSDHGVTPSITTPADHSNWDDWS